MRRLPHNYFHSTHTSSSRPSASSSYPAIEPSCSSFKHSKDLTMIDSPSSSSTSALPSEPPQPHKPRVAPSVAAETIILNSPAHTGPGRPGPPSGQSKFVKPKGFEDTGAPSSATSTKTKSKKRKSGEVEPAAGGGLLRIGELGLAELAGEEGAGAERRRRRRSTGGRTRIARGRGRRPR